MLFFNFIQIVIDFCRPTVETLASDLGLHCLPMSHKKDGLT